MKEFKYNKSWTLWIIIILLVIIVWSSYNGMVSGEENVEAQWGNVENVYQRRADLIPNLVNTVKGYAAHEQETFIEVVEARTKATSLNIDPGKLNTEAIQKFQQAQDGLTNALSKLLVIVERYPDLKANQNFLELQAQLEGAENRIAVERRKYNEEARDFNKKIKKFPGVFLNKFFSFEEKGYFEAQEGTEKVPEVTFE
ncbi:MAG: LemA family protein [Bacteroidales bacterium]|nr:LemA family protein [Bacteroidales bacterium]